jgi:hypothetical protein
LFCFCSTGNWTQDYVHAGEILYLMNHALILRLLAVLGFELRSLHLLSMWATLPVSVIYLII